MDIGYLLPPLIVAGIGIILMVIVLMQRPKRGPHWLLFLLLTAITLWALIIFGMRRSPDTGQALLWDRAVIFFVYAVPLLYYHFSLVVTGNRGQRNLLRLGYVALVVVIAISPTALLVQRMEMQPYGYAPIIGPAMLPIAVLAFLLVAMAIFNLFRAYRSARESNEKNRMLYITMAMVLTQVGAVLELFPSIYPSAIFGNIAFGIFTTLAILKYNLLDIQVYVRKSLVYLLLSAVVAIPYVGLLLLLGQIVAPVASWWIHAITILLLAIILRPLYSRVQQLVDRLFYRDRYDYLKALERFSRDTQSVANLKELGATIVELVNGAMRNSSTCLLLPSDRSRGFSVISATGLENVPTGIMLRERSPLIRWLKHHPDILSSNDLNIIPQLQNPSLAEKSNLEQMGADLFVPIKAHEGELSGVMVLGQKLSQQTYSNEERQVLVTLSNQVAMALENARLYGDAIRARENLETWLNSMSDCVMIVNADHTVQFLNKATVEKFGGMPGMLCWDILEKRVACSACPIQHQSSGSKEGIQYVSHIEGRQYDVLIAPLLNPDRSFSVIEVMRDITERKEAEDREKRLQEELYLSSRLASIGELAAGVAHEVNNPLGIILLYSETLMASDVSPHVKRDLRVVRDEAKRATKIMKDLLTYGRKAKSQMRRLDLHGVLKKVLDMRRYEEKVQNISVATNFHSGPLYVQGNSSQLVQVFINLVLNAEEAVRKAKSGNIVVTTGKRGRRAEVSVADDGPGIMKGNLSQVFHPFFTTKRVGEGTGLGLSTCYGIITNHGGLIHVENNKMGGATFTVELPLVKAGRKKVHIKEEQTGSGEQ
jgi:signal transduction histidine kinase